MWDLCIFVVNLYRGIRGIALPLPFEPSLATTRHRGYRGVRQETLQRNGCQVLFGGLRAVLNARFAALSRGVCGTIGKSLVLNLPGNPAGAQHSLQSVLHLIPHALDLLGGRTEHSATQ